MIRTSIEESFNINFYNSRLTMDETGFWQVPIVLDCSIKDLVTCETGWNEIKSNGKCSLFIASVPVEAHTSPQITIKYTTEERYYTINKTLGQRLGERRCINVLIPIRGIRVRTVTTGSRWPRTLGLEK